MTPEQQFVGECLTRRRAGALYFVNAVDSAMDNAVAEVGYSGELFAQLLGNTIPDIETSKEKLHALIDAGDFDAVIVLATLAKMNAP
jgi:hypothetical protein